MTDTQIKNAKPQSKDYPIYDGSGLLFLIKSTGTKIWQFSYNTLKLQKISLSCIY
ncbi:integrase arm-type DNA-binding domain-containing protein [Frischella japonica]|uniref:integrase arm-type DNA-binding domain-containing protein n=1 Tax=Frischella japonica TaxID=2741544 RepID=UPI0031B6065A